MNPLLKLISPDVSKFLLDELSGGAMPADKRRIIIQRALSAEAMHYVDSIHFMLCSDDDDQYLDEEAIEHTWELPAHLDWTNISAAIMHVVGFELSDWPELVSDYIKLIELATKSEYHNKFLLAVCKDPKEFLVKIRSIISQDDAFSL